MSGLILIFSTCLRPFIFTVTLPPPEEASTIVSSIFFCSTSYCRLACETNSCKLNPPILSSALLPIINDCPDLRAKFFLHLLHDRVLLGSAASPSIGCGTLGNGLRCTTGNDAYFDRTS